MVMSEQIDREVNQRIRSVKREQLYRLMAQSDTELDNLIKRLELQADSDEILWRALCKNELYRP